MFTESLYKDMIPLQTQLCFNCKFLDINTLVPYSIEEKNNWSMLSKDDRYNLLTILDEEPTDEQVQEFMDMYPNDGTTPGGKEGYQLWLGSMFYPMMFFPVWVNRFVPYDRMYTEIEKTFWYNKVTDQSGKLAIHTYAKIIYNLHQMVYASDPTKDWSVDQDKQ
jgi:hypothetical protein